MTKKESQKLKEKVLKNITEWSLDPAGQFYKAKELSTKTYESLEDFWFSKNKYNFEDSLLDISHLTDEDFCEIKKALVNDIKVDPQS